MFVAQLALIYIHILKHVLYMEIYMYTPADTWPLTRHTHAQTAAHIHVHGCTPHTHTHTCTNTCTHGHTYTHGKTHV